MCVCVHYLNHTLSPRVPWILFSILHIFYMWMFMSFWWPRKGQWNFHSTLPTVFLPLPLSLCMLLYIQMLQSNLFPSEILLLLELHALLLFSPRFECCLGDRQKWNKFTIFNETKTKRRVLTFTVASSFFLICFQFSSSSFMMHSLCIRKSDPMNLWMKSHLSLAETVEKRQIKSD